jgi:hypothetical protein
MIDLVEHLLTFGVIEEANGVDPKGKEIFSVQD